MLVHKFICQGTVEEKIDAMIESKRSLSTELLDASGEAVLTELSDADLLKTVAARYSARVDRGMTRCRRIMDGDLTCQ